MSDPLDWQALTRCVRGVASEEERAQFERWRARHPEHEALLAAVREIVLHPESLSESFDAAAARRRLEQDLDRLERNTAPVARPAPRSLRLVVPPRRRAGRRWLGVVAAAVVIALVARRPLSSLLESWRPVQPLTVTATTRGQFVRLQLEDGTRVTLGAESRLRYAPRFGTGPREVYLEGEGHFDVVHDARRPFRVHAGPGVAEDLGTEFVVRAYPDDRRVRVVVASGKVALRTADTSLRMEPRVLEPGQLGRLAPSGETSVERVDPQAYLAWTHGRLVFDRTPVPEVLAQLERWYDTEFELADSSIAGRHFTGAFESESLQEVLDAIGPPLHVRIERRGSVIVLVPLTEPR